MLSSEFIINHNHFLFSRRVLYLLLIFPFFTRSPRVCESAHLSCILNLGPSLPFPVSYTIIIITDDDRSDDGLRRAIPAFPRLQSRDSWLESLMAGIPATPAVLHLTKFIDICRVNLFDTVTQYRAIFPSAGIQLSSAGRHGLYDNRSHAVTADACRDGGNHRDAEEDDDADEGADFSDCKILTSWLLLRMDACLEIITKDLISCIETEPFFPIDSIIDSCFYFGLSLTRIGADIRPRLLLIFNNIFHRRFRRVLGRASKTFLESLAVYEVPTAGFPPLAGRQPDSENKSAQQTGGESMAVTTMNPPHLLVQFEPLAVLLNGIISALNEIRSHASIMNVCKMRDALNESLVRGTAGILSYCR